MSLEITALGSPFEFDTTLAAWNKVVKIDATHYLIVHQGPAADGYMRIVELSGGSLSFPGNLLEFDTADALHIDALLVDGANHVLVVWQSSGLDGKAQIFTVNTSTWDITAEGSPVTFDSANMAYPALAQVDSSHALVAYSGSGSDGFLQSLAWDGSWNVSEVGTPVEFDTANNGYNTINRVNNDDTRYLVCHQGGGDDAFARVCTVDKTTWNTSLTSSLEHDTANGWFCRAIALTATDFLLIYAGGTSAVSARAVILNVNPASSYAITEVGSGLEFLVYGAVQADHPFGLTELTDDASFYYAVIAYRDGSGLGVLQTISIAKSGFAVATEGSSLQFDATQGDFPALVKVDADTIIGAWQGADDDGFTRAFDVAEPGGGETVDESLEDETDETDVLTEQLVAAESLLDTAEEEDALVDQLVALEVLLDLSEETDEALSQLDLAESLTDESEESDQLLASTLLDESLEDDTEEEDAVIEGLLIDESLDDETEESDALVEDKAVDQSLEDETEESEQLIEELLASVGLLGEVEEEDEILESVVSALGEELADESEESDAVQIEIVRNVTGGLYTRSQGQWNLLFGS